MRIAIGRKAGGTYSQNDYWVFYICPYCDQEHMVFSTRANETIFCNEGNLKFIQFNNRQDHPSHGWLRDCQIHDADTSKPFRVQLHSNPLAILAARFKVQEDG